MMILAQMKRIIKCIKESNRVAVFTHSAVDADGLSSMLSTVFLIEKMGKQADYFVDENKLPFTYEFMNIELNKNFDKNNYDLFISVDVASSIKLGAFKDVFETDKMTISIDHHNERSEFAKLNYLDTDASACAQIIADFYKVSKIKITPEIATLLYAGISADTGCFLHDNTTSNIHKLASMLIDSGADISLVNYNLYKRNSLNKLKLNSKLIENIKSDSGVSYVFIKNKQIKDTQADWDDVSDFVNTLLSIDGTKIAFIVKQKNINLYTVSFRCLKGYNVSKVAKKYGGGGHVQASGCSFLKFNESVLTGILEECKKEITRNNNNV